MNRKEIIKEFTKLFVCGDNIKATYSNDPDWVYKGTLEYIGNDWVEFEGDILRIDMEEVIVEWNHRTKGPIKVKWIMDYYFDEITNPDGTWSITNDRWDWTGEEHDRAMEELDNE